MIRRSKTVDLAIALLAASLLLPTIANAQDSNDDPDVFYFLGTAIGRSMTQYDLSDVEAALVLEGFKAKVDGKARELDEQVYGPKLQAIARARQVRMAEREQIAAAAFVEAQAKQDGAEQKASGLVIQTTEAGSGDSPAATDTVKVHYHGTLRDGTVFDSSVQRGAPAEFPLNRVIPCWTEGLQLMKPGGKARLVCPSAIAYGEKGMPPTIPGGAALVFDVELIEVVAN